MTLSDLVKFVLCLAAYYFACFLIGSALGFYR